MPGIAPLLILARALPNPLSPTDAEGEAVMGRAIVLAGRVFHRLRGLHGRPTKSWILI